MKDVSILNEMIFSASTENELQEKFKDIYHRINNESEYDDSGSVEFLPLPRLNSRSRVGSLAAAACHGLKLPL